MKITRQVIEDEYAEHEMMLCDGFDECIIGVDTSSDMKVVYNANKMIQQLVEKDEMSIEEAHEYFSFNITGAYVGTNTPIYVWVEL